MFDFIYFLLGLVIGGTVIYLLFKYKNKAQEQIILSQDDRSKKELEELKQEVNSKVTQVTELSAKISSQNTEITHLQNKLKEQKDELSAMHEKFSIEFKNLANDILEEKSKKFTEQNKTNIGEILKPLNEKIKEFEKKVEETYDKEAQQRFSLKEEVKRLAELNQQISKEAHNLTRALKGESKTQGNWGEVILESILEKSGLVKNREYFVQESFTTSEGKRLQPDVVIEYPGERSIVIDSKVSVTAYERFINTDDESEKDTLLKAHLQSVKNHINELASKSYQNLYQLKTLDFVMLFMPVEPAYLLAIQADSQLWNFAYDKRVLLISPTNLIAALRMIESMWRQEYQNRNAQEIAEKSGNLYDKFVGFVQDLLDIGNKLNQTKGSYDAAMNKLSTGKGSLVKRAEDIKALGIESKKNLPQNLLDRAEESIGNSEDHT